VVEHDECFTMCYAHERSSYPRSTVQVGVSMMACELANVLLTFEEHTLARHVTLPCVPSPDSESAQDAVNDVPESLSHALEASPAREWLECALRWLCELNLNLLQVEDPSSEVRALQPLIRQCLLRIMSIDSPSRVVDQLLKQCKFLRVTAVESGEKNKLHAMACASLETIKHALSSRQSKTQETSEDNKDEQFRTRASVLLDSIGPKDLLEATSMARPPAALEAVFKAVLMISGMSPEDCSWSIAKKEVPRFIANKRSKLDASHFQWSDTRVAKAVREELLDKITLEKVKAVSTAGATLYEWVSLMVNSVLLQRQQVVSIEQARTLVFNKVCMHRVGTSTAALQTARSESKDFCELKVAIFNEFWLEVYQCKECIAPLAALLLEHDFQCNVVPWVKQTWRILTLAGGCSDVWDVVTKLLLSNVNQSLVTSLQFALDVIVEMLNGQSTQTLVCKRQVAMDLKQSLETAEQVGLGSDVASAPVKQQVSQATEEKEHVSSTILELFKYVQAAAASVPVRMLPEYLKILTKFVTFCPLGIHSAEITTHYFGLIRVWFDQGRQEKGCEADLWHAVRCNVQAVYAHLTVSLDQFKAPAEHQIDISLKHAFNLAASVLAHSFAQLFVGDAVVAYFMHFRQQEGVLKLVHCLHTLAVEDRVETCTFLESLSQLAIRLEASISSHNGPPSAIAQMLKELRVREAEVVSELSEPLRLVDVATKQLIESQQSPAFRDLTDVRNLPQPARVIVLAACALLSKHTMELFRHLPIEHSLGMETEAFHELETIKAHVKALKAELLTASAENREIRERLEDDLNHLSLKDLNELKRLKQPPAVVSDVMLSVDIVLWKPGDPSKTSCLLLNLDSQLRNLSDLVDSEADYLPSRFDKLRSRVSQLDRKLVSKASKVCAGLYDWLVHIIEYFDSPLNQIRHRLEKAEWQLQTNLLGGRSSQLKENSTCAQTHTAELPLTALPIECFDPDEVSLNAVARIRSVLDQFQAFDQFLSKPLVRSSHTHLDTRGCGDQLSTHSEALSMGDQTAVLALSTWVYSVLAYAAIAHTKAVAANRAHTKGLLIDIAKAHFEEQGFKWMKLKHAFSCSNRSKLDNRQQTIERLQNERVAVNTQRKAIATRFLNSGWMMFNPGSVLVAGLHETLNSAYYATLVLDMRTQLVAYQADLSSTHQVSAQSALELSWLAPPSIPQELVVLVEEYKATTGLEKRQLQKGLDEISLQQWDIEISSEHDMIIVLEGILQILFNPKVPSKENPDWSNRSKTKSKSKARKSSSKGRAIWDDISNRYAAISDFDVVKDITSEQIDRVEAEVATNPNFVPAKVKERQR
jgi:hypothetical protein